MGEFKMLNKNGMLNKLKERESHTATANILAVGYREVSNEELKEYILLTKIYYVDFEVLGLYPNNSNTFNYLIDLFTSEVTSLDEDDKDDETIDYSKQDFTNVKELLEWYEEIMMAFDEYYQVNFLTPQEVVKH